MCGLRAVCGARFRRGCGAGFGGAAWHAVNSCCFEIWRANYIEGSNACMIAFLKVTLVQKWSRRTCCVVKKCTLCGRRGTVRKFESKELCEPLRFHRK